MPRRARGSLFHFSQKFSPAGRHIPQRPSLAAVHDVDLHHGGHFADDVTDEIELIVVFEIGDAIFVGPGRERGDDDGKRRKSLVFIDEVDVAVTLGDLHDAPKDTFEPAIFRIRLDVRVGARRIKGLAEGASEPSYQCRPSFELYEVSLRVRRLPDPKTLSGTSSPPIVQDGFGIEGVMSR